MQAYLDLGIAIHDDMYSNQSLLMEWVNQADIVLIHWWNHPALFDIMVNSEFPACRLVVWNHVSALHPPYIHSNKLIEFADRFIFTSSVSYEAEEIINLPEHLKERLGVVWSSCGTDIFNGFKKQEHDGFNVGMTGTVDYGKLHPDFVKMCSNIRIPIVKFIVCSGDSQERVKDDAIRLNIADRFSFNGRVPSIMPYLAIYDIFGYPLQPKHLGTCEQALGEAMMAGVVPVVLNNAAEKNIIENGVTGIIADSKSEYCRAIEHLYHNADMRERISKNAIIAAREKYSITNKMMAWDKIFENILGRDKRKRLWDSHHSGTGADVFIESLGNYGAIFCNYIDAKQHKNSEKLSNCERRIAELFHSNTQWYSENKGGIKQYLRLFPQDKYLNEWKKLLEAPLLRLS